MKTTMLVGRGSGKYNMEMKKMKKIVFSELYIMTIEANSVTELTKRILQFGERNEIFNVNYKVTDDLCEATIEYVPKDLFY